MISLFLIFIFATLAVLLFFARWVTGNKIFGKLVGYFWLSLFGSVILLIILNITIHIFLDQKVLSKNDYYGEYVVNRNYFHGKQADWQYENFRFEIKENDSLYFYVTNKEKVIQTYRGTVSITNPRQYPSVRLIIKMNEPIHHILSTNPTTYRGVWDFDLVFYSHKFNNVFFTKGKWKPLTK